MKPGVRLSDVSRRDREPLTHLENADLMTLPAPLDDSAADPPWKQLSAQACERYECGLDDTCALSLPQPKRPKRKRSL
jgi:hypothetical protein